MIKSFIHFIIRPGEFYEEIRNRFERIFLRPNESKTVIFVLPAQDLSFWDVDKKAFVSEPGIFKVMIGSSSEDIRSKGRFKLN